jgi:2'-5' RNA ligase
MIREAIKIVKEKLYEKGVYMSLKLVNGSDEVFKKYIEENLSEYKPTPDPHLTLIYSKKPFDGEIKTVDYEATGIITKFSLFGDKEKALVAEIDSNDIKDRNRTLVEKYGFISDFDEYRPHITLVYGIEEDFDLSSLPKFPSPLTFGKETVEELDLSWG